MHKGYTEHDEDDEDAPAVVNGLDDDDDAPDVQHGSLRAAFPIAFGEHSCMHASSPRQAAYRLSC